MSDNQNNQNQNSPQKTEYSDLPPYLQKYFQLKDALKGPDLIKDEEGLSPKRFSRTYFEDTCPFCETTAEHEGKKYKYSKLTKKKILTNSSLMLIAGFMTGIGILNIFVGIAAILVLGYATSTHTERKMYYTLLCRNCGAHFPMDKNEQDKIRQEQKEEKEQEQKEQEQEQKEQEQEQKEKEEEAE
jgi:hypothetical protein